MHNKEKLIQLNEIIDRSYMFLWNVNESGYLLVDHAEVISNDYTKDIDDVSPWISGSGALSIGYPPLNKYSLHRKFGKLELTPESILLFANKYGYLGNNVILLKKDSHGVILAESIKRWQTEIVNMALLLRIWDLIQKENAGKLGQIIIWDNNQVSINLKWTYENKQVYVKPYKLDQHGVDDINPPFKSILIQLLANNSKNEQLLKRWRKGDVIEPALYYVCSTINEHLKEGVYPKILPFRNKEVYFWPKNLLTALWVMFMWEVIGEKQTIMCQQCGKWIDYNHKNRKYCNARCRQAALRKRQSEKYTQS